VVNAMRPGTSSVNGVRLFFAADAISGKKFLVDTSSSYSILPHHSSAPQSGPSLRAANNRRIRCWGYRSAAVAVNGLRYQWNFLLADVRFPIKCWSRALCRSASAWSSPLHMVRKKDGRWQPCGDFLRLNVCTT
jgi:hypothetical protein